MSRSAYPLRRVADGSARVGPREIRGKERVTDQQSLAGQFRTQAASADSQVVIGPASALPAQVASQRLRQVALAPVHAVRQASLVAVHPSMHRPQPARHATRRLTGMVLQFALHAVKLGQDIRHCPSAVLQPSRQTVSEDPPQALGQVPVQEAQVPRVAPHAATHAGDGPHTTSLAGTSPGAPASAVIGTSVAVGTSVVAGTSAAVVTSSVVETSTAVGMSVAGVSVGAGVSCARGRSPVGATTSAAV